MFELDGEANSLKQNIWDLVSHAAVVSTLIVVLKFVLKLFHGTLFDMMIQEADSQGRI